MITKTVGEVISGAYYEDCLRDMFLHEEAGVSLRPLQATWSNKMNARAAMPPCYLAKFETPPISEMYLLKEKRLIHSSNIC